MRWTRRREMIVIGDTVVSPCCGRNYHGGWCGIDGRLMMDGPQESVYHKAEAELSSMRCSRRAASWRLLLQPSKPGDHDHDQRLESSTDTAAAFSATADDGDGDGDDGDDEMGCEQLTFFFFFFPVKNFRRHALSYPHEREDWTPRPSYEKVEDAGWWASWWNEITHTHTHTHTHTPQTLKHNTRDVISGGGSEGTDIRSVGGS
ncbi:hypothetical protein EX30DRAFT_107363 [Ascodesmis nigricans]|uniref:Uncharacterized protein n=1 Tax=Ascodesmis nigricans TaxID=341454 RepID=A0A4S2MQD6_9PEZI|nr:hypothetical protein EX30DRAFT_107363 [Ascodesmis nigricans]